MKARGFTGLALAAVLAAMLPGLLLLSAPSRLQRAELAVPALPLSSATPALSVVAPAAPILDAVPINPPTEALTGELAPVAPAAELPFARARPPAGAEVLALIVGIDDYPGSRHDLDAAVADADTIDAALARFGVPPENRVVLRDGQARREQLVEAIRALVGRAVPGTKVVLAFAGHVQKLSSTKEAIVAADGALLTDEELAVLLAPASPDRMWLLFATCYGGGFTEALGPGRVLTAAADSESLAYESTSIKGSYLVHHMVREGWLEGRAGPSVQDAFAYASARIAETGAGRAPFELDPEKLPLRLGRDDGEVPTVPRSPSGTSEGPVPSPPPPSSGAPTPTTTAPERRCTLLVVCRRT